MEEKGMNKYLYRGIMICLFITCIWVHIYKISEIPFGIHVDEMGMGYDAWCLKQYGVDRYLNEYPVYLTNYGGGQSALYAYLCASILNFIDLSEISIRLPGMAMFLLFSIYGIKTMQLLGGQRELRKICFLFMCTVSPVCIMLFRIGMDCNLMLVMAGIFLYYASKMLLFSRKRDFFLGGLAAGILLYTYALSYLVLVVFVIFLMIYLLMNRRMKFNHFLCMIVPLGVLAIPLILVQIVNMFDLEEMHIGFLTITKLFQYRSEELGISNLSINSIITSLKNVFCYDNLRYNTLPEFGTIYYISVPFFVIGFCKGIVDAVKKIKKRTVNIEVLYLIWFLLVLICGSIMEANTNRLNGIYISVIFFVVEGFLWVVSRINEKKWKVLVIGLSFIAYAFSFFSFCIFYFGGEYQIKYEPLEFFEYSLEEPLNYLEKNKLNHKKTYIGQVERAYIYFMEQIRISPYDYAYENGLEENNSISRTNWENQYQNYCFYLPESLDFNANYVIKKDDEYCNRLENAGFLKEELKYYNVYTFDLARYTKMDSGYELCWDSGVDTNNCILLETATQQLEAGESVVLVGYTYNKKNNCAWDGVYLKIGDYYFDAEIVERNDIVEVTGINSIQKAGILFIIPKEYFSMESTNNPILVAIDSKQYSYMECELKID